jgi:hypothetical protein
VWYIWGRTEIHTSVWWGNLKDKDRLENVVVEGITILKKIVRNRMEGRGLD